MFGIDERITELLGGGATFGVVLAVALLLGLRHATDPDHLAAVSTLIATEPDDGRRRAVRLGLAWGVGHATTLVAPRPADRAVQAPTCPSRPARRRVARRA